MKGIVFVCLLLLVSTVISNEFELRESFHGFMSRYNKKYLSGDEYNFRFAVFKSNFKIVDELNQKNHTHGAVFGVTKFFDLTPEEFKNNYLMKNKIKTPRTITPDQLLAPKRILRAPDVKDWRDEGAVTPVKDQGQCGSCWAFSVVENVESMWIIAKNASNETLRLSEQQVVDCDKEDSGCNGGDTPTAYDYIIKAGGLQDEKSYPYKAKDGRCAFDNTKVTAKISSFKYATKSKDEKTLKDNLVSWGPLSICVDAANWQYYQSGVMTAWQCAWINILDHCVDLVGYNTAKAPNYWIVRNSWNTDWGIDGYIHLTMNENTCGMTEEATTAVV